MEKFTIKPTPTTPNVLFDPGQGLFEISGKSLPENSFDFFAPLHEYMDRYVERPAAQSKMVFRLEYFNTSSTSHFLKLIKKLEKVHNMSHQALVEWYYDFEDDDMKEAGEDFKLLVKLPLEIIGTEFSAE